jgi:hypothetical protein
MGTEQTFPMDSKKTVKQTKTDKGKGVDRSGFGLVDDEDDDDDFSSACSSASSEDSQDLSDADDELAGLFEEAEEAVSFGYDCSGHVLGLRSGMPKSNRVHKSLESTPKSQGSSSKAQGSSTNDNSLKRKTLVSPVKIANHDSVSPVKKMKQDTESLPERGHVSPVKLDSKSPVKPRNSSPVKTSNPVSPVKQPANAATPK